MGPGQRAIFKKKNDIDLIYSIPGLGRFRCNAFVQWGAVGRGRVPAVEGLVATMTVKDCILEADKTKLLTDVIAQGSVHYKMQTFDQSLFKLYTSGLITYEEALRGATNAEHRSRSLSRRKTR